MSEAVLALPVGRVLRVNVSSYVVGCRALVKQLPPFGSLVRTDAAEPSLGLVFDIAMSDDPLVRQLTVAESLPPEIIQDQLQNRRLPVEISVLAVGYIQDGRSQQGIPPRPPLSLDRIYLCSDHELEAFTRRLDHLRLVLNSREVSAEELLVAHLRMAAAARPPAKRPFFLEDAGRELARLLSGDLLRLDAIVRGITSE
jgi:hypothetical protein